MLGAAALSEVATGARPVAACDPAPEAAAVPTLERAPATTAVPLGAAAAARAPGTPDAAAGVTDAADSSAWAGPDCVPRPHAGPAHQVAPPTPRV